MNLIKRIKTLWRLSGLEATYKDDKITVDFNSLIEKEPRMATIIKRTSPTEDFLNNVNKNE